MKLFAFDHHHNPNPWEHAPPWAVELREMLRAISNQEARIMATIDDLVADVAAEDTAIGKMQTFIQGLAAQIAALKSTTTDAATAAKIDALATDVTAQTAAITAAITPPSP